MPDIAARPFLASELIDYGKRKCDLKAYKEMRRRLLEQGLTENVDNMAMAVHLSLERELDGIEATTSRLKELRTEMEGLQINNGVMIDMKVPEADWHRFNLELYDLIGDAKFILNRWHRFVQASMLRGEKR